MIQLDTYFYFDFWSITHILWGIVIFFLLLKFLKKAETSTKFIILFLVLIVWEIFEFKYAELINFTVHGPLDTFWDIVFGMVGGLVVFLSLQK